MDSEVLVVNFNKTRIVFPDYVFGELTSVPLVVEEGSLKNYCECLNHVSIVVVIASSGSVVDFKNVVYLAESEGKRVIVFSDGVPDIEKHCQAPRRLVSTFKSLQSGLKEAWDSSRSRMPPELRETVVDLAKRSEVDFDYEFQEDQDQLLLNGFFQNGNSWLILIRVKEGFSSLHEVDFQVRELLWVYKDYQMLLHMAYLASKDQSLRAFITYFPNLPERLKLMSWHRFTISLQGTLLRLRRER